MRKLSATVRIFSSAYATHLEKHHPRETHKKVVAIPAKVWYGVWLQGGDDPCQKREQTVRETSASGRMAAGRVATLLGTIPRLASG